MSMEYWFSVFITSLLLFGIQAVPRLQEDCNIKQCASTGLLQYYKEVKCKPTYGNESCCPIEYDCSELFHRSNNKCYYHGEEYKFKTEVPLNEQNQCLRNCRCSTYGNKTYFNCLYVECPEIFQSPLLGQPCILLHSHESCCSVGTFCPKQIPEGGSDETFQCQFEGKKYYKGQRFDPKYQCKTCICDEGFNGTITEPWCKDITCNVELLYASEISRGCVPVYYTNRGCCPVEWLCPTEKEHTISNTKEISSNETKGIIGNHLTCTYGKLQLGLKNTLLHQGPANIECVCDIPPYVTCIMK